MTRLAVLILTYNEEKNIADCIRTAGFADEVVVVDSGSSDRTRELAESLGARCVVHPMEEGFAAQRNFALTATDADWVFYLDADERLTPEAGEEIRQLAEAGEPAVWEIKRLNVVFGQLMHYGPHRPDYSLRLYQRESVHWEGTVHEHAETTLPVRRMREVMHHYTYNDWETYFAKFNQYTSLAAKALRERGRQTSCSAILLHPAAAFFKAYILKQGYREGFLGFIMSCMAMFSTMVKYLKLKYMK